MSFHFRKCQESVRRESIEGSSTEFIGYRMPHAAQAKYLRSLKASISKSLSDYFDFLIGCLDITI